jgi:AmiR/NasT family two-component response regulator
MTTISAERLAAVFVEVADTLVDEFDLREFLNKLAERAAGLVDASAVGLMLADQRGRLEFMAGSDSRIVIEQAKGAVAQMLGITVDEAFAVIRAYARNHNRRLIDLAHTILTDSAGLPGLH